MCITDNYLIKMQLINYYFTLIVLMTLLVTANAGPMTCGICIATCVATGTAAGICMWTQCVQWCFLPTP